MIFGTLEFPDVIANLGMVMQLPALVDEEIGALEGIEHGLFLSWQAGFDKAFADLITHLGNPWKTFLGRINDADVKALQFCEHQLRRSGFNVRQRRLDDLSEAIRQVMDDVLKDSAIDDALRRVILHHLRKVDEALLNFKFGGLEALQDALGAAAIGIRAVGPSPTEATGNTSPSKVWQVLGKVALVLTLAQTPLEIANQVRELTAAAPVTPQAVIPEAPTTGSP